VASNDLCRRGRGDGLWEASRRGCGTWMWEALYGKRDGGSPFYFGISGDVACLGAARGIRFPPEKRHQDLFWSHLGSVHRPFLHVAVEHHEIISREG